MGSSGRHRAPGEPIAAEANDSIETPGMAFGHNDVDPSASNAPTSTSPSHSKVAGGPP